MLYLAVIDRALGGEILPKGAAEKNVDDLYTSADAEHGLLQQTKFLKERKLQPVALIIYFAAFGDGVSP
jgi:hypothetical protein